MVKLKQFMIVVIGKISFWLPVPQSTGSWEVTAQVESTFLKEKKGDKVINK